MIRAIAFDLDGTLVDSVADLAAAANHARVGLGLPALPEARVASYVGDGMRVLMQRVLSDDVAGQPEPELLAAGLEAFLAYYAEHLSVRTRPYPGVVAALTELAARGLPMAVVTNKPELLSEALLGDLDLRKFFVRVIGGDTLPQRKPEAEPLLAMAAHWQLLPEQILMVGDSANDVACARAAGCPVWLVDYGYADAGSLGADRVVAGLGEIVAVC